MKTFGALLVVLGTSAVGIVAVQQPDAAPPTTAAEIELTAAAPQKLETWQAGPAAWKLRVGDDAASTPVWPILNPDATEAWGALPYATRVYGGRPGDGSIEQERRIRQLTYTWGLSRYGDYYMAAWTPPTGERIRWQIPAADWNPNGPNVLTCASPNVPPLTVEK